jgi:hypothetical protein
LLEEFGWYLWNPGVDIATLGMVDDNTGPRILRVVRDVVVHEDDDVLVFEPALLHDLVRMADIRLQVSFPKERYWLYFQKTKWYYTLMFLWVKTEHLVWPFPIPLRTCLLTYII